MKAKLTKVLNIIVTILIVCVLLVSILILTVTLTSKSDHTGVPNLFGKAPISVLTNSMEGDDPMDFSAGDLLICDVVDLEEDNKYQVGDVVTFAFDIDGDRVLDYVTHRIYKENKDGTYQTKGDNNVTFDQDSGNAVVFPNIGKDDIVAVYRGTKIPGLGSVIGYLQTSMGFFLCVLLPMIIFFLYEAVRVVINIIAYNKEKAIEKAQAIIDSSVLTDEQKQRAIEEYLAAQNGEAVSSEETTVNSEPEVETETVAEAEPDSESEE